MKTLSLFLSFFIVSFNINGQQWRVESTVKTYYDSTSVILTKDSTHYYYDYFAGRGSNKMADTVWYDSSRKFDYINGAVKPYMHASYQHFDHLGRLAGAAYASPMDTYSRLIYTYSPAGKRLFESRYYTKQVVSYPSEFRDKYDYSYVFNTDGSVSKESYVELKYGGYPTMYVTEYTYDSLGYRVSDSSYTISVLSGDTVNSTKFLYENNAYGDVIVTRRYMWSTSGNAYDSISTSLYTYDSLRRLIIDNGGVNSALGCHWYTYSSNGDLHTDSCVASASSSSPFHYLVTYQYNAVGKISRSDVVGLPGNKYGSYHIEYVYHYQHYWPNMVADIKDMEWDITIYPVPASGVLNIGGKFKSGGEMNISIIDINGRQVRKMNVYTGNTLNIKLDISGLSSGNYLVNFEQQGRKVVRKLVVM